VDFQNEWRLQPDRNMYRNNKNRNTTVGSVTNTHSTVPGTDVDECLWGNGPFIAIQEREREYSGRHGSIGSGIPHYEVR
jgi:hypothetical protein